MAPEEDARINKDKAAAAKAAKDKPLPKGMDPKGDQAKTLYTFRTNNPGVSDDDLIKALKDKGKWPEAPRTYYTVGHLLDRFMGNDE